MVKEKVDGVWVVVVCGSRSEGVEERRIKKEAMEREWRVVMPEDSVLVITFD